MIQFYPLASGSSGDVTRHSVLRPRACVKLFEHEILSRHKYMRLIAEVIFKCDPAPDQAWTALNRHLVTSSMVVLMTEVMPDTQPDGPLMLLLATDAPTALSDMLDRSVDIQEPH